MNPDLLLVTAVASVFSAALSMTFAAVQVVALIRQCRKPADWRTNDPAYARWLDSHEPAFPLNPFPIGSAEWLDFEFGISQARDEGRA